MADYNYDFGDYSTFFQDIAKRKKEKREEAAKIKKEAEEAALKGQTELASEYVSLGAPVSEIEAGRKLYYEQPPLMGDKDVNQLATKMATMSPEQRRQITTYTEFKKRPTKYASRTAAKDLTLPALKEEEAYFRSRRTQVSLGGEALTYEELQREKEVLDAIGKIGTPNRPPTHGLSLKAEIEAAQKLKAQKAQKPERGALYKFLFPGQ